MAYLAGYERNAFVRQYIQDHITTQWKVYFEIIQDILDAADLITTAFQSGNKLLLCGNGGSAADCQHLAGEFVPMGLPAIALTTDTSVLTALSNDDEFSMVFSRQLYALKEKGDVLLGISTSGKSQNVCNALINANEWELKTIGLTGESGFNQFLAERRIDTHVKVPSTNTQHIQEAHIMIEHLIWLLVKEAL